MKRRIIALALILVMIASLSGCSLFGKSTAVKNAEAAITAIGTVTLDSEEQIAEARALVDALSDKDAEELENLGDLEAAERMLNILQQEAAEAAQAEAEAAAEAEAEAEAAAAAGPAQEDYDAYNSTLRQLTDLLSSDSSDYAAVSALYTQAQQQYAALSAQEGFDAVNIDTTAQQTVETLYAEAQAEAEAPQEQTSDTYPDSGIANLSLWISSELSSDYAPDSALDDLSGSRYLVCGTTGERYYYYAWFDRGDSTAKTVFDAYTEALAEEYTEAGESSFSNYLTDASYYEWIRRDFTDAQGRIFGVELGTFDFDEGFGFCGIKVLFDDSFTLPETGTVTETPNADDLSSIRAVVKLPATVHYFDFYMPGEVHTDGGAVYMLYNWTLYSDGYSHYFGVRYNGAPLTVLAVCGECYLVKDSTGEIFWARDKAILFNADTARTALIG